MASSAVADSGPTQGSAYAQSLQVTPHEGSLAVGAVFGEALAGHTANFARAQSQGLDLGAVGEAAQNYNCGAPAQPAIYSAVPEPLLVETGQPGAAQGIAVGPNQSNYPQQLASGFESPAQIQNELSNQKLGIYQLAPATDYFANEFAQATDAPYGEADTTYGGPISDPTTGVFSVSGLHSQARSGLINGVMQAIATSDIGSVNIAGGAVVINKLHWESTYPVSGNPTSSFSIGNVTIAGQALPSSFDLSQLQSAINTAISNLGFLVEFPVASTSQGIQFESPLEFRIVPNSNRDQVLDPIVQGVQPTYYQIANGLENGFGADGAPFNALAQAEPQQLEQALCQSDTPITVLDVTVASMDGGGFFNFALGGVNTSAGILPVNPFSLQTFGLNGNTLGSSQFLAGTAGTLGTPGSLGNAANAAGSSAVKHSALSVRSVKTGNATGTTLLAAALAGLGLLALLVEGDRRLMRRALRRAPVEDVTG